MSYINNILTGAETAVRANSNFAVANICQREELPNDEFPDEISIYLTIVNPAPNRQPSGIVLRVYLLAALIVFKENTRAENENERDPVTERKSDYVDAMVAALYTNNPWSTNPITGIYQVDWIDTVQDPPIPAEIQAKPAAANYHRILTRFNYHTYEA